MRRKNLVARGYKPKVNAKGRNEHQQFIPVPYSMAQSIAWRKLSGSAMRVYFEVRHRFNGHNNGEVVVSYAQIQEALRMGRKTISKSLSELEEKGLLELITIGHFKGRKANEWRVTDMRYKNDPPTNEWRKWKPGVSFKKTNNGSELEL